MISVEAFSKDAENWFAENTPRNLDFMLPLTFMEVGTDQQFEFLRDWQRRVYEAGFLGAAWPSEYGGGGLTCLLYTSPSPRDGLLSRMPSSA